MNYLETIKNITKGKNKKIENLVFLLVLLVVLLFACTYIFNENNTTVSTMAENTMLEDESNTNENNNEENIEEKLSNILSQISGISDVSVALTYTNSGQNIPTYNVKETVSDSQTTTEKNVAYNEENGDKVAIIETIDVAEVEGAIIVARGANTIDMKSKIANAVATSVGIPVYKVQVFEKE